MPRQPLTPTLEFGPPKTWAEDRQTVLYRIQQAERSLEKLSDTCETLKTNSQRLLFAVVAFGLLIGGNEIIVKTLFKALIP